MTRSEEGYTLLELLISVAIVALFATPMAQSIQLGIKSWRSTHDTISVQERDLLVRDRLATWMAAAYPFDVNRKVDIRHYPLTGTSATLNLVTAINPDPNFDAKFDVRLSLQGENLVVDAVPDHNSYSELEPVRTVLLEGVRAVEFSYLDTETLPSNSHWVEEWQGRFNLPAAFKMKVEFTESARLWPELIVGPVVEEWSHCAFDGESGECSTGGDAG